MMPLYFYSIGLDEEQRLPDIAKTLADLKRAIKQ